MKSCLLFTLFILAGDAFSMEWRYRTYTNLNKQEKAEWKAFLNPQNLVPREFQGFIEYETSFTIETNKEQGIYLGEIGDVDKVYVNDALIGQTGDFPPNYSYNMDIERQYFIPESILNTTGPNKLKVVTYNEYFVNKGLDTSKVAIGNNTELTHQKYKKEIWDNFSKIILPLLCLILAAISFPPFAPKALWLEQTIIFLMGISSFILGVFRGRIGFHFFDMLLTYKAMIASSIITIGLIAVSSIGLKKKFNQILAGLVSCVAVALILALILQDNLIASAAIAKIWFHIAPFFILAGIICVFRDKSKNIPLKAGLIILFFADLNDVLHDLKIIHSVSMLQTGLGVFVLLLITNQLIRLKKSWESFYKKEFEFDSDAKLGRQAVQLAHDIRSPLEALKSSRDEIAKLPELERTSINLAIGRIEEIAYNLLLIRRNNKTAQSEGHTHVKSTMWQIIQEKNLQFRNYPELSINFSSDKSSFEAFSAIEAETFKRIISNLIDNAAEAIELKGQVEIKLFTEKNEIKVEVIDYGPAIPTHNLKSIFEKGFTTKDAGNGLGLHHAKKEIESAKGKVTFTQTDKTVVQISLPTGTRSSHFASEIDLTNIKRVIILDDDGSIHQVWKKKFKNQDVELEHFYKAFKLLSVYKEIPDDCLLLSDYELLGEKVSGIDCINKLHATHNSILVTARADEQHILKLCKEHGIKILPKSVANDIEIKRSVSMKKAVLIDDDEFTQISWIKAAKKAKVDLKAFSSVQDFLMGADTFDRTTPIYIDSNLGDGQKGEILSEDIFKLGFSELFMATGHLPQDIEKPSWIKEVLGKKPPFVIYQQEIN